VASIDQANSDANEIIFDDEGKEVIHYKGKQKYDESDEFHHKPDHADYIVEDENYEKLHCNHCLLLSKKKRKFLSNTKTRKGKPKLEKSEFSK